MKKSLAFNNQPNLQNMINFSTVINLTTLTKICEIFILTKRNSENAGVSLNLNLIIIIFLSF